MDRRRHCGAAAALALAALIPPAGAAQSALEPARVSFALAGDAPTPVALKTAYHVRLTSTWPQETAGDCRNGGEETLDGTLTRNADGTYSGSLARTTRLLFCGARRRGDRRGELRAHARREGQGHGQRCGGERRDQPERLVGADRVDTGAGARGGGDGRLSGGVQGRPPGDVSHHPPWGGGSAHHRGRGPADGAAGELRVDRRARLSAAQSLRFTSMSIMTAGGTSSKTTRRSTVRMTILSSGPLPLPRP